jgi:hypothetical protein
MSHEVIASVRIPLPDAPGDMATRLGEVASAWGEFLAGIEQGTDIEVSFVVNQTRTRPAGTSKRGRKPRLAVGDVAPSGVMGLETAA